MSWLTDRLKEATAQINPFDKGKTAATVRQDRVQTPPAQTIRKPQNTITNNPITRGASRVYDQSNMFDNGRTYKQRTPTNNRSVLGQATHNGVTNTVGNIAVKPVTNTVSGTIVEPTRSLVASATGNSAARQAAEQRKFTALHASLPGMAVDTGVNIAKLARYTPEAVAADFRGFQGKAPTPNQQRALHEGLTAFNKTGPGMLTGPAQNAINAKIPTAREASAAAGYDVNATGAKKYIADPLLGAVSTLGTAGTIKVGVAKGAPIVKQGAQKTAQAAKQIDQKAFTPRVNVQDQNILRDYSDMVHGSYQPQGKALSDLMARAREIGARHGVDLVNGSPRDRQLAVNSVLDRIGQRGQVAAQQGAVRVGDGELPQQMRPEVAVQNLPQPVKTPPMESPSIANGALQGNGLPQPRPQLPQVEQPRLPLARTKILTTKKQLPQVSSDNNTIAVPTVKVKLNTDRLNPDGGHTALSRLDSSTAETIAKMSNKDVQNIAKNAGIDTKTFTDEQVRQKMAEQLNVRQDAVRLQNEADIARKSGNTDLAEQLLRDSAERGRTSRMQGTDLARQLQARRIVANELDTPQQRIFKLLDNAGVNPDVYVKRLAQVDFTDPKDVVTAYRELVPAKPGEWIDVVRYNSMLSSPLTHIVNVGSNALNVGVVAPIEKTVRGVLDATGSLFGRERKYAAGEGLSYAKGAATSLGSAAHEFVDAMKGTSSNASLDLADVSTPLALGGAKGATYSTLSFPMRLLGASDKFFRALAEGGENSALNLRQSKGIKLGGNQKALAEGEASYRLYQQDTNLSGQGALLQSIDSVTNSIMALRGKHTWAKFVFPFVKTPTNILKQGIEFSPLGFANAINAEDKVTALTRAAIGTAVFGASAAMLGNGDLTWGEPTNADERSRFKAEGKQPYSVRIGDKWVAFNKLPPAVAFPFALTAGVNDAIKNKKMSEDTGSAIFEGIAKWGQFLGDQSYAKNIGDTLASFKGDKDKAVQAVANYPQQLVPFRALTGWLARMTDGQERKIDTSKGEIDKQVQALMLNYPGLRNKLDTRDYRGQPIPANNPVLNAFSPVRITDNRGVNPIDAELDAAKSVTDGDPLLTKAQNNAVQKRASPLIAQAQRDLLQTQEYKSLAPEDRKKALDGIKNDITAVESRRYQAENNVGIYAQGYTGEADKPSARQSAIENGNFDAAAYARSGDTKNKTTIKGDDRGTALLDKVGTLNDDQKKEWESKELDPKYKDLYDRASQVRFNGLPDLPKNNKTLSLYADLLEKRGKGMTPMAENKAKLSFLKEAYKSELPKESREILSASTGDILDGINAGYITKDQVAHAVEFDNLLLEKGLSSSADMPNKVRRELGYGDAPSKSGGGSGGGRGGAKFDYKLYGFGDPLATNKSLRQLLKQATLS